MGLFEGNKRIEGSRSNTALRVSGHESPAEDWLLDPKFMYDKELQGTFNEGTLFTYEYGGPGMTEVTIAKGRVMGVSTPVKDFVSKKFKTVLTLPGLSLNNNTVGVAPYNFTKDLLRMDRLGGNQLAILTEDYITLPYMPGFAPKAMTKAGLLAEEAEITVANKMPWGAVIGQLEVGDYVKATASGRLTKWAKGKDCPSLIIGQALAQDLNQEQIGWAKWMLFDEKDVKGDDNYMNRFAHQTNNGKPVLPGDDGYGYQEEYMTGKMAYQHYHGNHVTNPTGIPGLHDGSGNFTGFGKNDTEYADILIGETLETIEAGKTVVMAFSAKDFAGNSLKNLKEVSKVVVGDVELTADQFVVNAENGQIVITLTEEMAAKEVKATYKAFHYGTNPYLDFKGVHGAFNILLSK